MRTGLAGEAYFRVWIRPVEDSAVIDRADVARVAVRMGLHRQARAAFRWLGGDAALRLRSRRRAAGWPAHNAAHPVVHHGATQIVMHVLADDPRARKLAGNDGMLDRHLCRLWNQLVTDVRPDAVLDVGANYGEVAFSTKSYGSGRVVLIEPNPRIAECLHRTVADNGLMNTEVHAVAAGASSGTALLHIDPTSSGLSRLVGSATAQVVDVPVVRADDLFPRPYPVRLLAKVDVEGHEIAVIDGMRTLLEECETYAIICEFVNLRRAELFALSQRFEVALVNRYTLERRATNGDELAELIASRDLGPFLKDALLTPQG